MPRVAKELVDLKSLARTHTPAAIRVLASVMNQPKAPASARVFAANSLLDRGWGKAPVQLAGEDGGAITVTIRQIIDIAHQSIEDETKVIEHITELR
jgi:hypothetical protein